jgi:hypothetical protein
VNGEKGLLALRKMIESATPGPWVSLSNEAEDPPSAAPMAEVWTPSLCKIAGEVWVADAALIAASHEVLPMLLDLWEAALRREAIEHDTALDSQIRMERLQQGERLTVRVGGPLPLTEAREALAAALNRLEGR